MFLLDTNVVSELRSGRAHAGAERWSDGVDAASLYVSAITIQEMEIGVLLVERRDPNQGELLRAWLDQSVRGPRSRGGYGSGPTERQASRTRPASHTGRADRRHRASAWHHSGNAERVRLRPVWRTVGEPLGGLANSSRLLCHNREHGLCKGVCQPKARVRRGGPAPRSEDGYAGSLCAGDAGAFAVPQHKGQPLDFGSLHAGKSYVSVHLMPLYMCPALTKSISPALKKRMQGKTCFNFKSVPDEQLVAELRGLTLAAWEQWSRLKWL